MRPPRLSVDKDSELQRTLAQELLGMSRAADRFMGEEEAEREVSNNASRPSRVRCFCLFQRREGKVTPPTFLNFGEQQLAL